MIISVLLILVFAHGPTIVEPYQKKGDGKCIVIILSPSKSREVVYARTLELRLRVLYIEFNY